MKKIKLLVVLVAIFSSLNISAQHIKVYFNRTVNNTVASPPSNLAKQLNGTIDDTLAAYMNRATLTMDIAIYNFDTYYPVIYQAINNAYARGVQIRIVADGGSTNSGLGSINAAIPIVLSPTSSSYGIMHNKFVVIDANSSNTALPTIWTGSTNWTKDQIMTDANNVIIFQDKPLALAYTTEFNEMWGSTTMTPNAANQKFGPDKTDNTPHEFTIDGKRVECYFSPSDYTNTKILNTINTANKELYFEQFSFTRTDLATAITNRISTYGVYAAGLVNDTSSSYVRATYYTMEPEMGNRLMVYLTSLPGILHNKYLIVDQAYSSSDPLVETGSQNWSTSGAFSNDENIVIVHDALIANQYYQEFNQRFKDNGGILASGIEENNTLENSFLIYPNPVKDKLTIKNAESRIEKIELRNIIGEEVFASDKINSNETSVDVNSIDSGIYFLKITTQKNSVTSKVVIE